MNPDEIRLNQQVFAEVNERIAGVTRRDGDGDVRFMCECGRDDCISTVLVGLTAYRVVRGEGLYLAASGHCVPGVDRLVDSRSGYDVVAQD